jgi:glycosyltransferase involved in cell wall biosynthesis
MNVGGPARHVTLLATRSADGRREILYTGRESAREGSLVEAAVRAGAQVCMVEFLQRRPHPLKDLAALIFLYRKFRQTRPTIVATHTAKAGAVGRVAAYLARVPIRVHTFHGHVLEGYFGGTMNFLYRSLERLLARITTHFVAISPEIASQLEKLGIGRGRVSVIRLGLDLEPIVAGDHGRLRDALGLSREVKVVGIVGRLVPIKAVDLFLDAARLVATSVLEARFVVIGDGELWDELHQVATTLGLDDKVYFTGWLDDLPAVYSDLDLVVCCSKSEGTPASLIEAGAAGRPVVGTRVGGMADIITDGVNGILVPSGDLRALAGAITRLVSDPELASRMGQAGRRMSLERNGAARLSTEIDSLYGQLLASRAR